MFVWFQSHLIPTMAHIPWKKQVLQYTSDLMICIFTPIKSHCILHVWCFNSSNIRVCMISSLFKTCLNGKIPIYDHKTLWPPIKLPSNPLQIPFNFDKQSEIHNVPKIFDMSHKIPSPKNRMASPDHLLRAPGGALVTQPAAAALAARRGRCTGRRRGGWVDSVDGSEEMDYPQKDVRIQLIQRKMMM